MTATSARKPVERKARLDGNLLTLVVGKTTTTYIVEPLAADFGLCVRLRKQAVEFAGGPVVETEIYDVCLDLAGRQHLCGCLGALYHHSCKHIKALLALHAAGKLEPVLNVASAEKARQGAGQRLSRVPALLARLQAVMADERTAKPCHAVPAVQPRTDNALSRAPSWSDRAWTGD